MKAEQGIQIINENGRRIIRGVGYYPPVVVKDLRELVKRSVKLYGDKVGFKYRSKNGGIDTKSYVNFDSDIDALGTYMMSLGLAGKSISMIGENRYEWSVAFFSAVNGTGVAVPLDKYLPQKEVENLLKRSRAEVLFFSPSFLSMVKEIAQSQLTPVKYFVCMEALDVDEFSKTTQTSSIHVVTSLEESDSSAEAESSNDRA